MVVGSADRCQSCSDTGSTPETLITGAGSPYEWLVRGSRDTETFDVHAAVLLHAATAGLAGVTATGGRGAGTVFMVVCLWNSL